MMDAQHSLWWSPSALTHFSTSKLFQCSNLMYVRIVKLFYYLNFVLMVSA
jgi:hypothetical protein